LEILKTELELNNWVKNQHANTTKIGFVPTMGALHEGHIYLVKQSVKQELATIVSIFVNPKQFNNASDLNKYPITIEADIKLLKKSGCNALFIPTIDIIYPSYFLPIKLDLGILDKVLEGPKRPGHFNGVAQVVYRLFKMVNPDKAFFGLKDFQQCKVIKLLASHFFTNIKIELCPTIRHKSGLAMSSRNMRLSDNGKKRASLIYKTLNVIKNLNNAIEPKDAIKYGKHLLAENNIEVEYLELANSKTLDSWIVWQPEKQNILLIAAYIEGVRLIDNIQF